VNPIATMLSGMLMLRYLKEFEAAEGVEKAIAAVIAEGESLTYDMKTGRSTCVGTSQVADAVIARLNPNQIPIR